MTIGYIIILYAHIATPLTDDIYPSLQACEEIVERIHVRRPDAILHCAEVQRP
ncbi:hypothetical protein CIG19_16040 [Enterobacterales bacterium CwR94]|nr:hypothetical protein CIG19_16040 [Enterobacterales bacterium CwR94]